MNCEHLKKIDGLQFMPVRKDKRPIFQEWQHTKKEYDLRDCQAVGLVCGAISGNLEVIDIDLKYDLTQTLFTDLKNAIHSVDSKLLKKLVVQKTMSGGYHFLYRCSEIGASVKLANRPTTLNERNDTYKKSLIDVRAKGKPEGVDDFEKYIEDVSVKASENDKVRVLLETRGNKSMVVCAPSEGYEIVHGTLETIQEITPEERSILFNVAYSFNQVLKEPAHDRKIERKKYKGRSPSEDYNDRGDVIQLLVNHGWQRMGRKGNKILMKRPGDTKAEHSGNFDEEKNWFSVFSTSTQFEAQTPYQPYAVFAILECDGKFDLVPSRLRELGYGDEQEEIKDNAIDIPVSVDLTADASIYVATEADYDGYLYKWRNNTFEKGKELGIKIIDDYFVFKEADFVVTNGIDNVGKSTIKWYLAALSAMYHKWNWIIWSSENKVGGIVRKLIEFYWCEPIESMTDQKYNFAKAWVKEHFTFIKNSEHMYNYQEILNIVSFLLLKKTYKGLLIDPYNALKIDIPKKTNQNTYDYHYEAASKMKLFGQNNNLSIYLNMHAGTNAARNKDKDNFTKAPQKEDSEMGVMFANKADEFLTIHRNTQSETEFMFTELHVRKVKEIETGGRVTPIHKPIIMQAHMGAVGFDIKDSKDIGNKGFNPVRLWHDKNLSTSQGDIFKGEIKETVPESSYIIPEYSNEQVADDVPF